MIKATSSLLVALLLSATLGRAQGVRVGTPGPPDPSAVLDVSADPSAPKGFLPPRLTQAQRNLVSAPTPGLFIYQTDATPGYYYYNGTAWSLLGTTGPAGATGPQGVVKVGSFGGIVNNTSASTAFSFVGPTTSVTITSSTQKLVASAAAPLGLSAGGPSNVTMDMCYQPAAGGPLTNFVGFNYSVCRVTTTRTLYTVSSTVTGLRPGTYNVGFGVSTGSSSLVTVTLDNNDYMNGWVMLVN